MTQKNRSYDQAQENNMFRSVDSDIKALDVSLVRTTDFNNTGVNFMTSKYTPN